jgi:peptidyl-prolyl cis-trans isomerase B (cyclophilin B)
MSKAPAGWYPKPDTKELGYWDGKKWLDIPPPPNTYQNSSASQAVPMSGFAIASLVTAFLFFPLAIVFGHIALNEIKKSKGKLQGEGLAIAGLIIGYLWVFAIFIAIVAGAALNDVLNSPDIWST